MSEIFNAASHLGLQHYYHYTSRSQLHAPFSAQTDAEIASEVTIDPWGTKERKRPWWGVCVSSWYVIYYQWFPSSGKEPSKIPDWIFQTAMTVYLGFKIFFKFYVRKLDEKAENIPSSLEYWYKWSTDLLNIPPTLMALHGLGVLW